jgi:hypothetical protein
MLPVVLISRGRIILLVEVYPNAENRTSMRRVPNNELICTEWGRTRMPGPGEPLPGRTVKMPVPAQHYVNGHPLSLPIPRG